MYNVQAKYLVEVFKYPGTGDRIPPDAPDGYGSMPMIGLYGLVDLYSITRITTTRLGLTMGRSSPHPNVTVLSVIM